MPITKSEAKRLKQNILQRSRNDRQRLKARTLEKKIRALVAQKKADEAAKLIPAVSQALDKAAKNHVIHKNTAANHKSRLMSLVAKAGGKMVAVPKAAARPKAKPKTTKKTLAKKA